jgi:disulfide bond formation protein DsbB
MFREKLVGFLAILAVLVAIVLEILFMLSPCNLCSIVRVLLLLVGINSLFKNYKFINGFLLLLSLLVSSYQALMQYGLIKETSCKINLGSTVRLDDILHSCSKIDFTILGLPFSIYNIVFSGALLMLVLVSNKR